MAPALRFLLRRRQMSTPNGYVIAKGYSTDGQNEPWVAIATLSSRNEKTGNMISIWLLLENHHPIEVVKEGLDSKTICKGCPFASGRGCYVIVFQAPSMIWHAFKRGAYPDLEKENYAPVFGGRAVRFGAYGNPSLLPIAIVQRIVRVCKSHTGYYHDWQSTRKQRYGKFFMASTETPEKLALARAMGFRAFHVSEIQPENTIECLADSTNGRVKCIDCKLACDGKSGKNGGRDVWINPHGSGRAKAIAASSPS